MSFLPQNYALPKEVKRSNLKVVFVEKDQLKQIENLCIELLLVPEKPDKKDIASAVKITDLILTPKNYSLIIQRLTSLIIA